MSIALLALRYLWPFIVGGLLWYWANDHWCNGACKDARSDLATEQGKVKQLEDYASAQEALAVQQRERWTQQTAAEEMRAKHVETLRAKAFAGRANAARSDAAGRAAPVPATERRMLGDAYQAAVAAEATAKPDATPSADTSTAALTAWGIEMLEWATVCRDRAEAWQRWYGLISTEQP